MLRILTKVSVTFSFLVLGFYAGMVLVTGHKVAPYLLIAPTIGILAGLNYLRIKRQTR